MNEQLDNNLCFCLDRFEYPTFHNMVGGEPEMIPLSELTTIPVWVYAGSVAVVILIVLLVLFGICCWRKQTGRHYCIKVFHKNPPVVTLTIVLLYYIIYSIS